MHGKGFTSLVRSASFRTDVKEVVARFAGETNRLPLIPLLAGFDEVVHPLDTGLGPSVLELPLLSLGAHIAVARFQLLFLAVQDQRGLPLERRADHGDRHAHRADRRPRLHRVLHNPDFLEARHVRGIFTEVLTHHPGSDFAAFADRLGGELYGPQDYAADREARNRTGQASSR
jgi:hypothetical protein